MNKKILGTLIAAASMCAAQSIYAEEPEFLKGLTIGGGITLNMQNLQNSNYVKDPLDPEAMEENRKPSLGQYSIDLEIEKEFDENNTAFLHFETGKGDINPYLNSIAGINRDADDSGSVALTEAWLKHKFSGKFSMSIGVLDPTQAIDENAFANDETSQFINSMFRNAANIGFSDNAFGLKGVFETSFADFAAQYIDASDSHDMTRNGFASAQVNFKPGFVEGKEGNYRFYGWTNTNDNAKMDGTGDSREKDYGGGISLDQELTDSLGIFARYSWSRGDIDNGVSSEHTWSAGAQAKAGLIGKEDIAAIAYGQIIPSKEYKDNINADAKAEQLLEVYYSWNVNDYLSISPDFQLVKNPLYNKDDKTAYVSTIRMQISF